MKLNTCADWKSVKLDDRTILRSDLEFMSAAQVAALGELEVVPGGRKGYYKTNATNLERLRTAAGLSQSKLAAASEVSVRMIQKYELGEKDINGAAGITLYRIAQALHCQIEDLLEK